MTDTVEHWYAAFTGPNEEERADRSLRQAGYATHLFYELVNRKRPIRGRPDRFRVGWEKVPLYKRYIFVGARAGHGLMDANNADGVSTILHIGHGIDARPAIIPHRVIDALANRADANGIMDHRNLVMRRDLFQAGQLVEMADANPFSGIVFSVTEDTGKVVRAVANILGHLTPIELPAEQLRAI